MLAERGAYYGAAAVSERRMVGTEELAGVVPMEGAGEPGGIEGIRKEDGPESLKGNGKSGGTEGNEGGKVMVESVRDIAAYDPKSGRKNVMGPGKGDAGGQMREDVLWGLDPTGLIRSCPYRGIRRRRRPFPEAMGRERYAFALKEERDFAASVEWEEKCLVKALFKAYKRARRNGRNSYAQVRFEMNLGLEIPRLARELRERRYRHSRCIIFIVFKPVKREVIAPAFRDQVVDHLVFGYLSPIFEKIFIYDAYSCREGKGTDFGIDRLEHHIRSCSENYTKPCYVLCLDIRGYFMSMNHNILYDRIMGKLIGGGHRRDAMYPLVAYLVRVDVYTDPTVGCVVRGRPSDWKGLPRSKSYFYSRPGTARPIGKLTSQLYSNIMMDILCQELKRRWKVRYMSEYVDDVPIAGRNREGLLSMVPEVRVFVKTVMGLTLHPRKVRIYDAHKGVPFLGTVITAKGRYLSGRAERNMYENITDALLCEDNPYGVQAKMVSARGHLKGRRSARMDRLIGSALVSVKEKERRKGVPGSVAGWNSIRTCAAVDVN